MNNTSRICLVRLHKISRFTRVLLENAPRTLAKTLKLVSRTYAIH